jgi:low temperature requirement protein LtrA
MDEREPPADGQDDIRVSTIELFFDLVFVFTITQLTSLLIAEPTWRGVAQVVLIFGNLWWMYGGYVWLTNAVPPSEPVVRLLLLAGMGAFLVVALSIPDAFGDAGIAFGVGYLIVNVVHAGIFLTSSQESVVRSVRRLGPTNITTAALLLVAGFTSGWLLWTLWIATFVLHWFTPFFTATSGFHIRARHFVERHGLILLIALGESVVAVGLGVRHVDVNPGVLVTALLGLALAASLWWLYFDGEDERAERALVAAQGDRRTWLSLYAFGYVFLPILIGIVVMAAGVKLAVLHHGGEVIAASSWFLAGGAATYVAGLAWFRWMLRMGPIVVRTILAAVCLATVGIGLAFSPEAQMGALVAILVAGVIVDERSLAAPGEPAATD